MYQKILVSQESPNYIYNRILLTWTWTECNFPWINDPILSVVYDQLTQTRLTWTNSPLAQICFYFPFAQFWELELEGLYCSFKWTHGITVGGQKWVFLVYSHCSTLLLLDKQIHVSWFTELNIISYVSKMMQTKLN